MRISSKGQVTIPANIRNKLGLLPNTEIFFEIEGSKAIICKGKANYKKSTSLIRSLTAKSTVKISTDEIMKLTR